MSDFPTMPTDISFEVSRLHAERNVLEAELKGYKRSYENVLAERDALAAHVEIGSRIAHEWRLEAFDDEAASDQFGEWLHTTPATSLAKLKAEWQAEALERYALWLSREYLSDEMLCAEDVHDGLLKGAKGCRRQAEGGE